MEDAVRQGDVIVVLGASLPNGAKKLKTKVVAYGEVTGHKHQVVGDAVLYNFKDVLYAEVTQPSNLVHDTHGVQVLDPGVYEFRFPKEFDYVEHAKRRVQD